MVAEETRAIFWGGRKYGNFFVDDGTMAIFYPEGMEILAVARMNRPNGTHTHNRRARQLAESFAEARAPRARGGEGEMVPEHLSLEDWRRNYGHFFVEDETMAIFCGGQN
mgnify:CR=1 FL=1